MCFLFGGTGEVSVAVAADFVCQRAFVEIVENIVECGSCDIALCFLCEKRLMRGDEDVRESHETGENIVVDRGVGAVFEEVFGLLLIDIESGGSNELLFQSFDERRRINESAAACVQEEDARLHHGDGFAVDEVPVFGRQRAVEGNDVAATEEFFQRNVFNIKPFCLRFVRIEVVREDFNAESLKQFREGAPDFTSSDDSDGFSVDVESDESVDGEIVISVR